MERTIAEGLKILYFPFDKLTKGMEFFMETSKITVAEAISIVLGIFVAYTLVALPRSMLEATKTSTLINLIYVGIIALLITFLIYKLLIKFPGSDIVDIAEYLGGKPLKTFIGIIFIFYFLFSSSILLRNFCECLKIVYYPMTSLIFIILTFIIVICITLHHRFSSIAKVNLLIIPLVIISIIFLFIANMKNFSLDNIFPIFGDGLLNTFVTGLGNLGAFGGITILYFLPPYLKEPQKMKKIYLTSIILGIIYFLLCVSIILFMFISLMYTNQIMPLYSAARYIEFGNFFQRLESIFLLIWILQMICYLTIVAKISLSIFKKITNIRDEKPLIFVFGLLIFAISLLPKNYAVSKFIEDYIYHYMVIIVSIFLGVTLLILAYFKKRKKKELKADAQKPI